MIKYLIKKIPKYFIQFPFFPQISEKKIYKFFENSFFDFPITKNCNYHRRIFAYNTLMKLIRKNIASPHNFLYNEYGRIDTQNGDFYVNISYSGDYIAVILSDCPVGIDIQKVRRRNDILMKHIGVNCKNLSDFSATQIFSQKESFSKALSQGLNMDFNKIIIKNACTHNITINDDYVCAYTKGEKR